MIPITNITNDYDLINYYFFNVRFMVCVCDLFAGNASWVRRRFNSSDL